MSSSPQAPSVSSADVQALVVEHLPGMEENSPRGHVHALAIQTLRRREVPFWWRAKVRTFAHSSIAGMD